MLSLLAALLSNGDKKIGEQEGYAVDNSFLAMFSYPFIAGDKTNALNEPNTIILTETLARKMFDIKDNDFQSIIGKTIVTQE